MNERIKELRKTLGLTQQEFSDRLRISRNSIATYETGKSNMGDAVLHLICREFAVNETWLRTGGGGMFIKMSGDEEIADFAGRVLRAEKPDFRRRLLTVLARMTPEEWDLLERKVLDLMAEMQILH